MEPTLTQSQRLLVNKFIYILKEYVYVFCMKYLCALRDLLISLIASTFIIYAINIIAGFAGADYTFTHGETFVIWILMAILVNNCLKR